MKHIHVKLMKSTELSWHLWHDLSYSHSSHTVTCFGLWIWIVWVQCLSERRSWVKVKLAIPNRPYSLCGCKATLNSRGEEEKKRKKRKDSMVTESNSPGEFLRRRRTKRTRQKERIDDNRTLIYFSKFSVEGEERDWDRKKESLGVNGILTRSIKFSDEKGW